MGTEQRIRSLLKEADVYHSQGLYEQSKEKHLEILTEIGSIEGDAGYEDLIDSIEEKMKSVDQALDDIGEELEIPELSEENQALIKQKFAFSKDPDAAAVEGAVALAVFGQYEKALAEFQSLLDADTLPMTVAKNMLQCHLNLGRPEDAVTQLAHWISHEIFTRGDLISLRAYLEYILQRAGIEADLPELGDSPETAPIEKGDSDVCSAGEAVEILAVRITFGTGVLEGEWKDFDTVYQYGNTITFNIRPAERAVLDYFELGRRFQDIQCYAPDSLFNATGVVTENQIAAEGTKKGHCTIVLELEDK